MNSKCIEWGKGKTTAGYGVKRINGKLFYVHRVVCADKHNISLDEMRGLVVQHTCDNPSCINPEHLILGTQADNMRDMREKRRDVRGSQHTNAKLTPKQVIEIRESYIPRSRHFGCVALAKKYGVTHMVISRITRGISYVQ